MAGAELADWLDGYIEAFAACGRGERDPAALLGYYSPPVLLTTDDVSVVLADESDILGWAQGQVDGMLAAGFARIEIHERAIDPLNAKTALLRGAFSRHRHDGSEISHLTATYLVTRKPEGLRIAALVIHSP